MNKELEIRKIISNVYIDGFSNGNNMESTDHKVVEKAIKDILKMIKDNEK